MKLTSITINNMFSYHGISTLRFENISCIIGTNGFGKTSILNSNAKLNKYYKIYEPKFRS